MSPSNSRLQHLSQAVLSRSRFLQLAAGALLPFVGLPPSAAAAKNPEPAQNGGASGTKDTAAQGRMVGSQREFLVRGTVRVAKDRPGQPSLRGAPKVTDVVTAVKDPAGRIRLEPPPPHQLADFPRRHAVYLPCEADRHPHRGASATILGQAPDRG